jgi:hypothetical protein
MAVGTAIDESLSRFSHEFRDGRRPTMTAVSRHSAEVLDRELADADVVLPPEELERQRRQILAVLRAFRQSEVMGMSRPRSRLILINDEVGVYAQPDYWDGRDRFYEMKSYRAVPTPPDVALQLRLFQCAFPGFRAYLASFDRHAEPVTSSIDFVPPPSADERDEALRLALGVGREQGTTKVLEYIDAPTVRYTLARAP